jgi:mono/diheme cytochrome c family protein
MLDWQRGIGWAVIAAIVWGVACSDESSPSKPVASSAVATKPDTASASPPPAAPPTRPAAVDARSEAEIVESGRSVYNANCIACHSMDPAQDGALGPSVAGADLELLRARVLDSKYPDGYTPKRDTRVMVALPHLEPKIGDLAAYLNSL